MDIIKGIINWIQILTRIKSPLIINLWSKNGVYNIFDGYWTLGRTARLQFDAFVAAIDVITYFYHFRGDTSAANDTIELSATTAVSMSTEDQAHQIWSTVYFRMGE